MTITRRAVLAGSLVAVGVATLSPAHAQENRMYGLIGKMTAKPGQRDALAAAILEGSMAMPGNLSYIVAADSTDADALWITEVWIDEASHRNSLKLPGVQAAIAKARPIIAGFGPSTVTTPIGGYGMAPSTVIPAG